MFFLGVKIIFPGTNMGCCHLLTEAVISTRLASPIIGTPFSAFARSIIRTNLQLYSILTRSMWFPTQAPPTDPFSFLPALVIHETDGDPGLRVSGNRQLHRSCYPCAQSQHRRWRRTSSGRHLWVCLAKDIQLHLLCTPHL